MQLLLTHCQEQGGGGGGGPVRRTWSLSDIVVFCPVLAAALANTLSGTGVNLIEKMDKKDS